MFLPFAMYPHGGVYCWSPCDRKRCHSPRTNCFNFQSTSKERKIKTNVFKPWEFKSGALWENGVLLVKF